MATITFLDANVLIEAHRGKSPTKELAQGVVKDPTRVFVVSPFLYLELMPRPIRQKETAEVEFLRTYFDNALILINDCDEIVRIAQEEAERHGIKAMDALHIAAASIAKADVLLTLEGENSAMYRTSLVRVTHLQ